MTDRDTILCVRLAGLLEAGRAAARLHRAGYGFDHGAVPAFQETFPDLPRQDGSSNRYSPELSVFITGFVSVLERGEAP